MTMQKYSRLSLQSWLLPICTFVALAITQSAAWAHYIWVTIEDGQARFALLEHVQDAPQDQFTKYVENLTAYCGNNVLALGVPRNGARYAKLPGVQNMVTAESIVGVKERGGEAYLLIYDCKGVASLLAASTLTRTAAEILAHKDGTDLVVSVVQNGLPVSQTEVWVQWPGDAMEYHQVTDRGGYARFHWPASISQHGFVGIRAMVKENTSGEQDGKRYASIHRWVTLTFPLNEAQLSATSSTTHITEAIPLTTLLRESYGNYHELAASTAFNQTVFAGKLTRQQLIIYFQQRALVHQELHRILYATYQKNHNFPYGTEQKHVLVLLFDDLVTLGADWPTEAQALPPTRAFLKEIQQSASQGPYFALGAWHVFYGGITNGGRLIGQKIGETIGFLPSYYEQSGGYQEYLTKVNQISDPHARQEMIQGGLAAYKFIIELSNEDIFKYFHSK